MFGSPSIRSMKLAPTNRVLLDDQKEQKIYYVPCYLRLKIKNIISISLENLDAELNVAFVFSLNVNGLSERVVNIIKENLILQLHKNEPIVLSENENITFVEKKLKGLITYTARLFVNASIDSDLFWSPFELLQLQLVVTVRSIVKAQEIFRFNLMDHPKEQLKISYTKESSFGNYTLATALLRANYTRFMHFQQVETANADEETNLIQLNEELDDSGRIKNAIDELGEMKNTNNFLHRERVPTVRVEPSYFQYATFFIPMYKHPFVSLWSVFLPLWSMALYNLFIFYQVTDLSLRISNGAIVLLTLFTFFPNIRAQIPHSPQILIIEILLHLIAITFILSLIQSFTVRNEDSSYVFVWQNDAWFITSLICSLLSFLIVVILSLMHKCVWEKRYRSTSKPDQRKEVFILSEWSNPACDKHFAQFDNVLPIN